MWASERGERRPLRWTLHAQREDVEHWPLVPTVERWLLRWLYRFLPWFLSCFMVSSRWVGSFIAELSSVLPGDSPRHRNLIFSAVTLGPLVSFRLTVFDFMFKNTDVCEATKVTVKRDLSTSCYEDAESLFCHLKILNCSFHIFPSNDFQIPFLLRQIWDHLCLMMSVLILCEGRKKNN